MNYETIDWDAEAKRVARAFGVESPLRFRLKTKNGRERRDLLSGSHTHIVVHEHLRLTVNYKPELLHFKLHYQDVATFITVGYNGEPAQGSIESKYHRPLIKGLFHLGLLSPSLEYIFGWVITAHDKLEWAMEYEQRWGTLCCGGAGLILG